MALQLNEECSDWLIKTLPTEILKITDTYKILSVWTIICLLPAIDPLLQDESFTWSAESQRIICLWRSGFECQRGDSYYETLEREASDCHLTPNSSPLPSEGHTTGVGIPRVQCRTLHPTDANEWYLRTIQRIAHKLRVQLKKPLQNKSETSSVSQRSRDTNHVFQFEKSPFCYDMHVDFLNILLQYPNSLNPVNLAFPKLLRPLPLGPPQNCLLLDYLARIKEVKAKAAPEGYCVNFGCYKTDCDCVAIKVCTAGTKASGLYSALDPLNQTDRSYKLRCELEVDDPSKLEESCLKEHPNGHKYGLKHHFLTQIQAQSALLDYTTIRRMASGWSSSLLFIGTTAYRAKRTFNFSGDKKNCPPNRKVAAYKKNIRKAIERDLSKYDGKVASKNEKNPNSRFFGSFRGS